MATWPVELQQEPNIAGYSRVLKDNAIRSGMSYGPIKIRRRTTMNLYTVTMQIWCDYPQSEIFDQFYEDNMSIPFDWLDFGFNPPVAATYVFLATPPRQPIGPLNFQFDLVLEMETSG